MNLQIEKTIKFKIHRFNPEQKRRYLSEYEVPVRKGTTLLDVFMYIKDNFDGAFAFRHSCRMGVCGSCGVMVNGKPMLACYTQVLHLNSDTLVIEPLQNMPIIKDLVVDLQPFFDTYKSIRNVLIKPEEALKRLEEFIQSPKDLKDYWDLSLCIKCSICYSACPAALDERFLGPSTYVTNYRFVSDSRDEGFDERLKAMVDNVWLCTSCNSCTEFCPKEISCASSIVDERGLLVEAGSIPRTVKDILTSVVRYHNPLEIHPSKRIDWAKDLEVKMFPTVSKSDVLFFIGCAPSYDPRSQAIAKSMVSVFNSLGIDFATLGTEERCSGDHVLRLGEKGLFEMLAEHNISMFEKFEAETILTLCPHCFNTLKNDKPYSNKRLNVQHYTQFLAEIIKRDELKLSKSFNKKVAYHDPCFLGKRNDIYDAPRKILKLVDGLEFLEMKRTMENSFCCGGGAGRTWTEDSTPQKRPSVDRVREALELGVQVIATACPFCVTTLEDAVKVLDVEDKIVVKEILELLKEAM
ncbi:MAG: succinate dehydrogenase iron-sulfur subunit [Candidatus Bathyarchaeota archaeon]|nr:MAG: succinate dehydrogenase iron-sulfur subunit [Candidatus Bathyarchaeota archaeon]